MVVEELIGKLGLRATGLNEARKFIKALEDCRKAAKGASTGIKLGFGSSASGLGRVTRDFERAAAAARRFRREAERPVRVGGVSGGGASGAFTRTGGRGPGGGQGGGRGAAGALAAGAAGGIGLGTLAGAGTAYYLGGQLSKSAKSALEFGRSLIEVGKATDTPREKLEAYSDALLKLSRETGKDKNDLAKMLSSAGFAGRPAGDLLRFTEYGAKAATAWQTSAEETGQSLAEIGNIYEANQDRIEQIGDAINTMADQSASRESDLLEFVRRAGASSRQAGLSAENILAFGAAMKEVGVRNEVAATGFEALLNVMKLGEEFSKSAGEGLEGLGIKSDKMRKEFVAKPVETMIGLLEKLNGVSDKMKRAEIMTNLFGKEYQDDIAKMLNALPKLRQYLDLMGNTANTQGSVRKQFAEQMTFDVSKIEQASAAIDGLQTRLGNLFKIMGGAGAEKFNQLFDKAGAYLNGTTSASQDPPANETSRLRELNGMGPEISSEAFNERFGKGTSAVPLERPSMMHRTRTGLPSFTRMPGGKYVADYQAAAPMYSPTLGAGASGTSFGIGGAKGGDWMRQGAQQTVQNITNNTNTGNDQRTQTASVTVNATGLEAVGAAVLSKVQAGLSSMGASVVKGNTAATGASTAP